MSFKTEKNLLSSKSTYNRYYGDFRGVDFSSDHTQVADNRFAFCVNMFRDYQSSEGKAIETVPGFRRRFVFPDGEKVYAIHRFCASGATPQVLIHAGKKLYLWGNYPLSVGVEISETLTVPEETSVTSGVKTYTWVLPENVSSVTGLTAVSGENLLPNAAFAADTRLLTLSRSDFSTGDTIYLTYTEGDFSEANVLAADMNERESVSFMFNNRLYLLDGKTYRVYDGTALRNVSDLAYIPTTYINIIPAGVNADAGTEKEARNILQPKFRHTFIADGETTDFYLNENDLAAVDSVKLYGVEKTIGEDYTVDLAAGAVKFTAAPPKAETVVQMKGENGGENVMYPEFYAGVEITASKPLTSMSGVTESAPGGIIAGCTVAATFDDRVFLSGNPEFPNCIFWCGRNLTGISDPTYFGVGNYQTDGVENAPITGMIPVADTLAVLKADTVQDGSVYFHTPQITDSNLVPKNYPSSRGLSGIGCLGACRNFLDDPVFVSRMGLEGIGQLSVRYERAIEHRSTLIDAKLSDTDLGNARLEEWNGYLVLLTGGQIFLADSRQKYTDGTGTVQYEWYYLDGIGVWKDQYREVRFAKKMPEALSTSSVHWCKKCGMQKDDCTCGYLGSIQSLPLKTAGKVYFYETDEEKNLTGTVANEAGEGGVPEETVFRESVSIEENGVTYQLPVAFTVHAVKDPYSGKETGYEAYLCEERENEIGGVFGAASCVKSMDSNLFFGTENGAVCSFNFDRRANGEIPTRWYTFDNRTILCGCATKMDCCGIPHLTKNTVKKSTVIKMKSMQSALAKVKVRTNRVPWNQIARINSALFSFADINFEDFSFITSDQTLFSVREKEKKWVEKQYYLYSDEYRKPFALYYISYRYTVAGRYKQ